MHIIDVVILVILAIGLIRGWLSGFFKQLTSLLGFFVGLFVAYVSYETLGNYLATTTKITAPLAYVLAFILAWISVTLLLKGVALLLTHTAKTFQLGFLNCIGGALLSLLQYLIVTSCLLNAFNYFHLVSEESQKSTILYNPIKEIMGTLCHKISDMQVYDKSQSFIERLSKPKKAQ